MFKNILALTLFVFTACHHADNTPKDYTTPINKDSLKAVLEERLNEGLADLDSTIGVSKNTYKDSLLIQMMRDSLNKIEMQLDSLDPSRNVY